jgi:hypothetical protein
VGWVHSDFPDHEGYPVALMPVNVGGYVRFRELGYPDLVEHAERVHLFSVGCECGWRSRRFYAPLTASYSPHSMDLGDDGAEDEARAIWAAHVAADVRLELERAMGRSRFLPAKIGDDFRRLLPSEAKTPRPRRR